MPTEAKELDLFVTQGSQYVNSLHWYGGGKMIRAIETLTPGCPTTITITAHGLPSTSPTAVLIDGVKGARDANTGLDRCDVVPATYVDANSFTIEANTLGQTWKTGTGCAIWWLPKDLTGWTARLQIREKITDTTPIVDLTTAGGDITISLTDAQITFTIATAVTEGLDFVQAVYDLELVDPSGEATRIAFGKVFLTKEVTR